jgi:hypothetical protein
LRVRVGGLVAELGRERAVRRGDRVWATFAPERTRVVPIDSRPIVARDD